MILTKQEILLRMSSGDVYINPFDLNKLNPNSYNLSLGNELLVYEPGVIDPKVEHPVKRIIIPKGGYILKPGELYLAHTDEYTTTKNLVPALSGRSSTGRLGLSIHVTAGFGDVGFSGKWTLEMFVIRPLVVYPLLPICQIYYHELKGTIEPYKGKYQYNDGVQPSMMWKEYQ